LKWSKNIWPKLRKDYEDNKIFNTDEIRLFFKLLLYLSILKFKEENSSRGQIINDYLTILMVINMARSVNNFYIFENDVLSGLI